jgi:hypothetical protein
MKPRKGERYAIAPIVFIASCSDETLAAIKKRSKVPTTAVVAASRGK